MHTTNYVNTFIAVADDCPADHGVVPPEKPANPSIASRTFALIARNPYGYTSDDVIFTLYADRAELAHSERPLARKHYFSTPRACLRASDLGKKYGWGIHANDDGCLALHAVDSEEYARLTAKAPLPNNTHRALEGIITVVKAMRSSRR